MLWTGQFVSQLGDRLAWVAFPWLVHEHTNSTLATGAVFALYTLPYVLFGAFAGVLVDRRDKRRLMITVDLVRTALVLAVPFVATRSLPVVFVLSFLISTAGVFFDPAKLSLLPELVPPSRLLRANSLLSTGENLTEVMGWALAGMLLMVVSTSVAFQIDAATFAVSAVALVLMRYRAPARAGTKQVAHAFWRELREGMRILCRDPGLRANTMMIAVCVTGLGAAYPLTFFFAVNVLDGGTGAFGALEAVFGAGLLVGSLSLTAFAMRVRKGMAMIVGLFAMGVCYALVATAGSVWAAAVPYLICGIANAVVLIAIDTFLQETVPDGIRGRVFGARFTLTQGLYALSVLVGGALAGIVDVRVMFVVVGIVIAISAIVGLLTREVRES